MEEINMICALWEDVLARTHGSVKKICVSCERDVSLSSSGQEVIEEKGEESVRLYCLPCSLSFMQADEDIVIPPQVEKQMKDVLGEERYPEALEAVARFSEYLKNRRI